MIKEDWDHLKGLVEHVENFRDYMKVDAADNDVFLDDKIEMKKLISYANDQLQSYSSERKLMITAGHKELLGRFDKYMYEGGTLQ